MKKSKLLIIAFLLIGGMITFYSCSEDDPSPLTIVSIVAEGTDFDSGSPTSIDLNAATSAEDVPLDAVIIITFSRNVDESTVSSSSISLTTDGSPVDAAVATSGATVTLTPASDFERGQTVELALAASLKASDGGTFVATTRSFKAAGRADVVPPQASSMRAYIKFDGDATDTQGAHSASYSNALTFTEDRFGQPGSAALFDGDATVVELPNGDVLWTGTSITISCWLKLDTLNNLNLAGNGNAGQFVMGLAGTAGFYWEINGKGATVNSVPRFSKSDGTNSGGNMFFNADGKDKDNGGFAAIEFEKDLTGTPGGLSSVVVSKWIHLVYVYDGAANVQSLYINGELMERDNNALVASRTLFNGVKFAPESEPTFTFGNSWALGFVQDRATTKWDDTGFGNIDSPTANHYKGAMDDVRFFGSAFAGADVTALYNAEKP